MALFDDDGLTVFLRRYMLARQQASEGSPPVPGGRFVVRPRGDGELEVWREGGQEPLAVFAERRAAYLAAAVFTAFGGLPIGEESAAVLAEPAVPGEVREPAPWSGEAADQVPEQAIVASFLTGLLRNPAALELLLEAAGPELVAEAQALAFDWLVPSTGTVH
jgi:hypothetical protein